MPRGRKKDLTITPTRSLVQQRDYRARRALYVANLEERVQRAEEENNNLRKELAEVKGRLVNPVLLLPETAAASSELMERLSSTKEALAKFNQLVFPNGLGGSESTPPPSHPHNPSIQSTSPQSRNDHPRRKELYVDSSLPPYVSQPSSDPIILSDDCCGGIVDCGELGEDQPSGVLSRTSDIRSTTTIER